MNDSKTSYISLATVFIAVFAQMLFLGENNVIYANILSMPVLLATFFSAYKKTLKINFHIKVLFGMLVFWIISYFWHSHQADIKFMEFFRIVFMIIFLVCMFNVLFYNKTVVPVFMAFWAIVIVNFLIFIKIIPQNLFFYQESWDFRFLGTFDNPNIGAICFVISIVFSRFYLGLKDNTLSISLKIFLIANMVLAVLLTIATASKKGLLLLVLFLVVEIIQQKRKFFTLQRVLVMIGLIFVGFYFSENKLVTGAIDGAEKRLSFFLNEVSSSSSGSEDTSTAEREYFLAKAVEGFLDAPFIGNGFKSFENANKRYSHNNLLELLYNGGLVAFLLYYSIFIVLIRQSLNNGVVTKTIYFGILVLFVIDFAAVTYTEKFLQYFLGTLFLINVVYKQEVTEN